MVKSGKIKNVFKVFLVLTLFLMTLSSVFALTELTYSPFSQAGSWSTGSTRGRNMVFDYDGILYVGNGVNFHKYDLSTWEYLGYQTMDSTIKDVHVKGSTLYLTQSPYVKAYDLDNSFNETDSWSGEDVTSVNSFDISDDNIVITGTGGIEVIDLSTKEQETHIVTSSKDVVRFTQSGESIVSMKYNEYTPFLEFHSTSSGGLLSSTSYSSGHIDSLFVSDTADLLIMSFHSGFNHYARLYNFTDSGVDSVLWSASGDSISGGASRLSQDNTLLAQHYGSTSSDDVVLRFINGTSIGSFLPDNSYETAEWSYIPLGNKYLITGTEYRMYVYYTGVATPLISTNNAEMLSETSLEFSMTVNDMGDATEANCTTEYKAASSETWLNAGSLIHYTDSDSFPVSSSEEVIGLIKDGYYDYRGKCDYITPSISGTTYGTEKTIKLSIPPFDIFAAVLDNFGTVMFLIFLVLVIVALASYGVTNGFAILAIATVLGFLGKMLNLIDISVAIIILVASLLISIVSIMLGGRE